MHYVRLPLQTGQTGPDAGRKTHHFPLIFNETACGALATTSTTNLAGT